MTGLIIIGVSAAVVVGLILALPCPACKLRRERLEAAYAEWRRRNEASKNS